MLTNHTIERLKEMRLSGMVEAYESQLKQNDINSLSFEERLGLLVDYEWTLRQDRRLKRLLKKAKLRFAACPEDINYRHPRGLDKSVMLRLAACEWIQTHQNVIMSGPTGVGKTYLSCALGNAACRKGYSTRYYRVPRLLSELKVAKGDGTYSKLLHQLLKLDLLILDDWGLAPLSADEGREILEVIEDRNHLSSTIIASQLPIEHWHEILGDPTVADAILDRLVHNAHKLILRGDSMRKFYTGTEKES